MKAAKSTQKISVESIFSNLDDNEKNRFLSLKVALESIRKDLSSRFRKNRYILIERIGRATTANDKENKPISEQCTGIRRYSGALETASHFLYFELKRKGMFWDTPLIRTDFEYMWGEGEGLKVVLNVAVNLKTFSSMNTARFSGVPHDNLVFCDLSEHKL